MNKLFISRVDFYINYKDIHDAYYADYILNLMRMVSHLRIRTQHAEEMKE